MSPKLDARSDSTSPSPAPPLTTEFIQPPDCTSYKFTSALDRSKTALVFYDIQHPSDLPASCYPSGWDNDPKYSLRFETGICPESWTYYSMGYDEYRDKTSAQCCPSGFQPNYLVTDGVPVEGATSVCHRTMQTPMTTIIDTTTPTTTVTYDIQLRDLWQVTWRQDDLSKFTMSYTLPELTSRMSVPTWVPGEVIPTGIYEPSGETTSPGLQGLGLLVGLGVGLGVGGLLLIVCGIWCCVRSSRKAKQRRVYASMGMQPPAPPPGGVLRRFGRTIVNYKF